MEKIQKIIIPKTNTYISTTPRLGAASDTNMYVIVRTYVIVRMHLLPWRGSHTFMK